MANFTRRRIYLLAFAALFFCFVYLWNSSWLARPHTAGPILLAHRGVHQTLACKELLHDTCTAACIVAPPHEYIENTIPSIRAAFDYGADVVEIDVHPTTDGEFAVFHDWRLECRTNGYGVTRERSMAYLRSLDAAYGYTADSGMTFPLRGQGVGAIRSLAEILDAFPGRRFLVNIKSNEPSEGDRLSRYLSRRPRADIRRLMVYGGERPVKRLLRLQPELRGLTRRSARSCLVRYALIGWTGYVPSECRHSLLLVPHNIGPYLWGWPHRFIQRIQNVKTDVFVVGPNSGEDRLSGIDTHEDFHELVRDNFAGGVWTDRIELVGPLVKRLGPP